MKTVEITPPSWETAVAVYMSVLENPHAIESGKEAARAELLRLARMFDDMNKGE